MLGGIIILIVSGFLAHSIVNGLKASYPSIDGAWLKRLFYYHSALAFVYYIYSLFNASDSRFYYKKVIEDYRGPDWMDFYGTSTTFIEFISYPFIRYLGFSYLAMMALFSFMGFIGFIFFYLFFKENIRFKHTLFGYDMVKVFLLLPNLHFWSSSLGKGAVIFPAIAIFFYSISKIKHRIIPLMGSSIIIYHIRPHIMLTILVSCLIGFIFSTRGISWAIRLLFIGVGTVSFFFIYQDVLNMVGIDEGEFISQGLNLSHRARELSKATSGIDISQYSFGLKLFTFIYRPLFFDAPGILGLIVSIENVFYVWITLKILNVNGIKFLFKSSAIVKSSLFSFLTISIALAQVSGNLGIAIRQKSQVMVLFLFVIISFLDQKKLQEWKTALIRNRKSQSVNSEKVA